MIHLLGRLPAPCLHQLSPYWGLGSPLLGSPLLLWGLPYRFSHPYASITHLHLSCASATSLPTIFFRSSVEPITFIFFLPPPPEIPPLKYWLLFAVQAAQHALSSPRLCPSQQHPGQL